MIRIITWKIILICTIIVINDAARYDNYTMFLMTPKTEKSLNTILALQQIAGYQFLQLPNYNLSGNDTILIVSPNKLSEYINLMKNIHESYWIVHDNVQEWMEAYNKHKSERSATFSYTRFHTLNEIYHELDNLAVLYPKKVETVIGGHSYENRLIKGVKVSFKANNPGIFIEGGIHSHQWMSPATVMYILHKLLTSKDKDVRELAERHDWYIFPVFNPDGYEFTHTTAFNRYWPKNRRPLNKNCIGVNLNMNWPFKWNTGGTRSDPCSPDYPGDTPFSEVETMSMARYIETISTKFYAYISFSGNQQYLLFPYGHTAKHVENYNELINIARKVRNAIKDEYGKRIIVGNIAERYGTISGCTVDYIYGVYRTRLVYMYQLYHSRGFDLPPEQILPMGQKALYSLVVMFKQAREQENKRKSALVVL